MRVPYEPVDSSCRAADRFLARVLIAEQKAVSSLVAVLGRRELVNGMVRVIQAAMTDFLSDMRGELWIS